MHVKINDLSIGDAMVVNFKTKFGEAKGIWEDQTPPCINQIYASEIQIDEILKWNDGIQSSTKNEFLIEFSHDHWFVANGLLESVDEDNFTVVRISNYIVTCFTDSVPEKQFGNWVTLKVRKIGLYPDYGMPVNDLDDDCGTVRSPDYWHTLIREIRRQGAEYWREKFLGRK